MPSTRSLLSFGLLACSSLLATAIPAPSSTSTSDSSTSTSSSGSIAANCCQALSKKLPGKVSSPGSSDFVSQVSSYYSALEAQINSACRVSPENTQDVVTTLNVLTANKCKFAVRSGGHMPWAGAANIGAPGVTIDMEKMNFVTVSADKKTASVGPGGRWGAVYDTLEAQGLIALGGRSNPVGVGGFLLGGGLSHLSPQHGLANDNVNAYEVVLANGTVTTASASVNPDLFFGLKGGSTNFGIVTRYDLFVYPVPRMWGGFRGYNLSEGVALAAGVVDMMKKQVTDTNAGGATVNWGRNAGESSDHVFGSLAYLTADAPTTDVFESILSIPFLAGEDTIRSNVNMQNISGEVDAAFPGGPRSLFSTVAIKADAQLPVDIYQAASSNFAQFNQKNVSWTASFQSLGTAVTSRIGQSSPNPQGLSDKDGNLLLLNLFVYWHDSGDDTAINAALHKTIDFATQTAKNRNLLSNWLYMNYCLPDQDVYSSYGQANLNKLKALKAQYDPNGVFDKLWPGGFKIKL